MWAAPTTCHALRRSRTCSFSGYCSRLFHSSCRSPRGWLRAAHDRASRNCRARSVISSRRSRSSQSRSRSSSGRLVARRRLRRTQPRDRRTRVCLRRSASRPRRLHHGRRLSRSRPRDLRCRRFPLRCRVRIRGRSWRISVPPRRRLPRRRHQSLRRKTRSRSWRASANLRVRGPTRLRLHPRLVRERPRVPDTCRRQRPS
jgi:hypothetical protein